MPEPTMRDLERMMHSLGKNIAATRVEVAETKAEVAKCCAEMSGMKLLIAAQEEHTAAIDHLRDTHEATNQILAGVRSLSKTAFDISVALSRRMKFLVQRLVERDLIAVEALREDEAEAVEGDRDAAKLRTIDGASD